MDKLEQFINKVIEIINDKRYYYSMQRENEFAVDCSSLLIRCLGSVGIPTNNASYTGNIASCLKSTGQFIVIPFNYSTARRGDMFLKHISGSNGHIVLYLGNDRIGEACNKKYGLRITNYYQNNYQYIIRYVGDGKMVNNLTTIKKGSNCIEVGLLQLFLNKYNSERLVIDCDFGSKTSEAVKNFQIKHNLEVDGIVGAKTWSKIYSMMVTS